MIAYTEKGHGLHERIAAAGHWLRQVGPVWVSSDDVAVQAIIDGYTLADSAQYVSDEIDQYAKTLRDRVVSRISSGELASWSLKWSEAKAYAATTRAADAPLLAAEAQARGVALSVVVARVNANATKFANIEAQIAGAAGKHKDAVKACLTFDAVLAYSWAAGWPAV